MTEEEIYEHFIVDEDLRLLEEIDQEKRDKDQAARDYEVALQARQLSSTLQHHFHHFGHLNLSPIPQLFPTLPAVFFPTSCPDLSGVPVGC